jgi:large subunit ribosomal protein L3
MALGLIGTKIGMTRVFDKSGFSIPVTVLQFSSNRVVQVKTLDKDGYNAVQVTYGKQSSSRLNKPTLGHFSKAGVSPGLALYEFLNPNNSEFSAGDKLSLDQFSLGEKVDVTGVSKGKGFQGGIKRWNFHMQDATHGNSLSHRSIGSTGQCQTPGRVWKGKKMAGHMGNAKKTAQSLYIVRLDFNDDLLLVKGSVPGFPGSSIVVKPAVKNKKQIF